MVDPDTDEEQVDSNTLAEDDDDSDYDPRESLAYIAARTRAVPPVPPRLTLRAAGCEDEDGIADAASEALSGALLDEPEEALAYGLLLPHHSRHARLLCRHTRLLPHGLLGHTAQHGVIDDPRGTRGRHPPLPRVVQHLLQLLHREV